MSHTLSLAALPDWLGAQVAASAAGDVALLAGHFALFTAGARAVDLLDERAPLPEGAADMTTFTKDTWNAACHAVSISARPGTRLLVLVDDIQFVRPALTDRAASERLGAALAGDYMQRTPTLPAFHSLALRNRSIADDAILRRDDVRWMFSERELRAGAVRRLRARLDDDDAASAGLRSSGDGLRIDVTLPDQPDYCLVHSGHTNCAGGFLELVVQAQARGVRTLIALVPMRCLGPVTVGAALARRLADVGGLRIEIVAVPPRGAGAAVSVVPL